MIERGRGGRLFFIGSVMQNGASQGAAAYSSSKAALQQVSRTMANELAEHRITVIHLKPGANNNNNAFFGAVIFYPKADHFAKTGSGQTQETLRSSKFCVGWIASAGERDAKGLTDEQVERSGAVVPLGRLGTS